MSIKAHVEGWKLIGFRSGTVITYPVRGSERATWPCEDVAYHRYDGTRWYGIDSWQSGRLQLHRIRYLMGWRYFAIVQQCFVILTRSPSGWESSVFA